MMQSSPVTSGVSDAPGARVMRHMRNWLENGVLSGGDRVPSEEALCQRLSVARTTVRSVLKQLEKEGVIHVQGKGRVVAENVRAARSTMNQTIAVLAQSPERSTSKRSAQPGWSTQITEGAIEAIHESGLHSLMLQPARLDEGSIARLSAERPWGVIAFRHATDDAAGRTLIRQLRSAGIHVVVYGYEPELEGFDTVASDHAAGEEMLTRWLAARGRKRILRCWEAVDAPDRPAWLAQRDAGYEKAVRELGLEVLPPAGAPRPPVMVSSREEFEQITRSYVGYLAEHLLGEDPVDAILGISDSAVYPIAAACRLLRKQPQRDVEIVGYDNYWMGAAERAFEPTPPLATADKHNLKMGRELVELMTARIKGELPEGPQHRLVEPRLVVVEAPVSQG